VPERPAERAPWEVRSAVQRGVAAEPAVPFRERRAALLVALTERAEALPERVGVRQARQAVVHSMVVRSGERPAVRSVEVEVASLQATPVVAGRRSAVAVRRSSRVDTSSASPMLTTARLVAVPVDLAGRSPQPSGWCFTRRSLKDHPESERRGDRFARIDTRTYVLDTSVLLADPAALEKFDEHDVVIPLVVLTELEAKRQHPDLGWSAREALRSFERLRLANGTLTESVPANDRGGHVRVELNHVDSSSLPVAFQSGVNDHRILAVARNLADKGLDTVLVSKDLPLRLKAAVVGLDAEEYRHEMVDPDAWPGMVELDVEPDVVDRLYHDRSVRLPDELTPPVNSGIVLRSASGSGLARQHGDGLAHLVDGDRHLFDVRGRSAEQRVALDLLSDESVGIVSLGGSAGTGKSVLALSAGLEAVLERRTHRKVIVFRPLFAVGGQELGYLPGSEQEKMSPWGAAVYDALEAIAGPEVIEEVIERDLVDVLPLTHIRGRTLTDCFVVVDEAQNLERMVLLTALTRLGENSRVVLTHDVAQRDNLRVGRRDGISSVVALLKGNPLFGHVTLTRSERSPVAALVADLLDAG